MKLSIKIIVINALIFSILLFFPDPKVSAHPGNTAADGCHYCRTNCDKWGVPWNERHCHGGGSTVQESTPVQQYIPPTDTPIPLPTWTPWPTNTPFPTRTPTPSITLSPTITLTPTISPTKAPTRIPTNTPTSAPEVKGQSVSGGFWGWVFSLFNF